MHIREPSEKELRGAIYSLIDADHLERYEVDELVADLREFIRSLCLTGQEKDSTEHLIP